MKSEKVFRRSVERDYILYCGRLLADAGKCVLYLYLNQRFFVNLNFLLLISSIIGFWKVSSEHIIIGDHIVIVTSLKDIGSKYPYILYFYYIIYLSTRSSTSNLLLVGKPRFPLFCLECALLYMESALLYMESALF